MARERVPHHDVQQGCSTRFVYFKCTNRLSDIERIVFTTDVEHGDDTSHSFECHAALHRMHAIQKQFRGGWWHEYRITTDRHGVLMLRCPVGRAENLLTTIRAWTVIWELGPTQIQNMQTLRSQ